MLITKTPQAILSLQVRCGGNGWTRKLRVWAGITRTVGCSAILALLAATLSTAADVYPGAKSSSPAQQSSLNKSMRKNLPNFGEATATLSRGGQPSKRGFRMLSKIDRKSVV